MTRAWRSCIAILVTAIALLGAAAPAAAQKANPFGAGPARQEQAPPDTAQVGNAGLLSETLAWIYQQQQRFHAALGDAVRRFKSDPSGLWLLLALSFGYGVFHAAGPGHGKAVLSSYMVANETQVKRGIVLAFAAALVQALTAVLLVAVLAAVLRTTGMMVSRTANHFEAASYALILLIGLWLVWSKGRRLATQSAGHGHEHDHGHHHHNGLFAHAHGPDPKQLSGTLPLSKAAGLVLAMGLRPCTGAILVLLFTFVHQIFFAGVLATFVMAAGTGLTVALLAALALGSKRLVVRLVGQSSPAAAWTVHGMEFLGAVLVALLGASLLAAALTAGARPF